MSYNPDLYPYVKPVHRYRTCYDTLTKTFSAEEYIDEPPHWKYVGGSAALTREDCINQVRKAKESLKVKVYEYFSL